LAKKKLTTEEINNKIYRPRQWGKYFLVLGSSAGLFIYTTKIMGVSETETKNEGGK
jgi:hypothetical protein